MIEERGIVIEKKGNTVVIKAPKGGACERCVSKSLCHTVSETEMVVEADDPVGVKVGDRVVFMVGTATMLKAGILFYLIPLFCFIAGVVIGQIVTREFYPGYNPDTVSTVLGFVFLFLSFIGLKIYSTVAEKRGSYRPRVIKVV